MATVPSVPSVNVMRPAFVGSVFHALGATNLVRVPLQAAALPVLQTNRGCKLDGHYPDGRGQCLHCGRIFGVPGTLTRA